MAAATSFISAVPKRLEGKVALITGGASGIGECTAKVFAHHGAKVVIADIQDDLGHSLCEDMGSSNCSYVHCNVTNEDHIKSAVDKAVATHGKLDIMFNNAGIIDPGKARIINKKKSDFEHVLSVNVTGVFLGIKHAARVMVPARSGSIISTASVSPTIAAAATHAYCASQHAVLGLTRNAAVELGQFGIRINCLSPYGVATPLAKGFNGVNVGKYSIIGALNWKLIQAWLRKMWNQWLVRKSADVHDVGNGNIRTGLVLRGPADILTQKLFLK